MGVQQADANVTLPESDLVTEESIVGALNAAREGNVTEYNKLLGLLKDVQLDDPASTLRLMVRLKMLTYRVSWIDQRVHEGLLTHVLGMSIWLYERRVGEALLEFVVNLATAKGGCRDMCIDMLVRNFLPPSCGLPAFLDSHHKLKSNSFLAAMEKARGAKAEHLARKDDSLQILHTAIASLLELVPTSRLGLQSRVFKMFPHKTTAKEWIVLYLESMLHLDRNTTGDVKRGLMLPAIVDKLMEIDVEIRWEDILRGEDSSKVLLFHMDLEEANERDQENLEVSEPSGPGIEHGLLSRSAKGTPPTLDEMADKMDMMMDLVLQYLQSLQDDRSALQVFETLMRSFYSTILGTFKPKFTQFLLFYFCSLAPSTCGGDFASRLCNIVTNSQDPPTTRMSAAAYLASYLARAKYLPLGVVVASLKRLTDWCVTFSRAQGDETADCGVFYSACQAIMYVLCFKLSDLVDDSEHKRVLQSLHLKELFEHKRLNPLKVCLPSVVEEFFRQAECVHLLDCRDLMEQNKKENEQHLKWFDGKHPMDMFFPFDPYLLRQSERHIRPNFLFWSMVHPPCDEDVSDVDDAEDYELADATGTSCDMDGAKSLEPEHRQMYHQDEECGFSFEESMEYMSLSTLPARLPAVLQRTQ